MKIFYGPCGPISVNTYFVVDDVLKNCAVIDPGDAEFAIGVLKEKELTCKAILLTHGHFDHVIGLSELKKETGAPVYIHKNDAEMITAPEKYPPLIPGLKVEPAEPDFILNGNETISVCGADIRVLHTPGHTPGGVSYVLDSEKAVFCGDTIFFESIGRTDFVNSSGPMLIAAIRKKLFALPDDYKLYPGHGGPTSVGHEKANNPYLRF